MVIIDLERLPYCLVSQIVLGFLQLVANVYLYRQRIYCYLSLLIVWMLISDTTDADGVLCKQRLSL